MYENIISERILKLRMEKGVSARGMSLALGQSPNYIYNLENRLALPSMTVFFSICDYFQMTPKEFFNVNFSQLVN